MTLAATDAIMPAPSAFRRALPGLAASLGLAALGMLVWDLTGRPPVASPMAIAMIAGVAAGNLGLARPALAPGAAVAMRPVLRAGIVLLGFRLTFSDLGAMGGEALAMIAALVGASFFAIKAMGRVLGVAPKLAELIAAGTSICGASAVLGVNAVTRARDEDVAYAIATVTIFGSLSMLLFPLLGPAMGLGDHGFGLWSGASIHEVAQAVGAGFAQGEASGETATIAKLSRVLLLAPVILGLGFARRGGGEAAGKVTIPWFVFGFLAAVAANTAAPIPAEIREGLGLGSTFLLATALGAMGLETRIARLRGAGARPLLLGAFGWVFISAAGLGGALLLG